MRTLAAAIALLLAGCGAGGSGGAVGVRWRIVDGSTGEAVPGCRILVPGTTVERVVVDRIRLVVVDVVTGVPLDCPSCRAFECAPLERTTEFEIPEARYLFSIEALRCGRPIGDTPPPVARTVRRGQITNLNAIQISIPSCVRTPPTCEDADAGVACPDGG